MDKKLFFKQRIDKIAKESFNNEQKEIAKKIIDNTSENDLDAVWGLISQRVKTGFVFDEAPEINHNCIAYLKENEKLGVNLENKEALEHALIIGENYDALKNLVALYTDKQGKGLIDVIYIDPPYNTDSSKKEGNDYKEEVESKKFIYRDKYTRDGWLNMINERLKLAKKLLSDSGIIFISIDDGEQAYLKVLCDDIFGEENFIVQFVIASNSTKNNANLVSVSHEYLLCYSKNISNIQQEWVVVKNNTKEYVKRVNQLLSRKLTYEEIHEELLELVKYPRFYDFDHFTYVDEKGVYETDNPGGVKNGNKTTILLHPITKKPCKIPDGGWRYDEETIRKMEKENSWAFGEDESIIPRPKRYLNDYLTQTPKSILYFDSQASTKWLKKQNINFDFPKAINYIKYIISMIPNKDLTILDFFAGSGTTGHSVMELNNEDGGKRKFILVTNNENNIAIDVTRERLYKAINNTDDSGNKNLVNNSLRVFEIVKQELNITEIEKAEQIKEDVENNFIKLKPDYVKNSNLNIYNTLASLTPYKDSNEE